MKIYKYLRLSYSYGINKVYLDTEDKDILDLISNAVKQKYPSALFLKKEEFGTCEIDNRNNQDTIKIGRMVRELIILQGWEIFEAQDSYHFKKEANIN